eukprot:INCI9727.1.p1 GENE.INCI9727.1~~INCI9727.1.p1  ORF type:complete len:1262 (+),score=171.05 INCI9727.1:222-4007(+)
MRCAFAGAGPRRLAVASFVVLAATAIGQNEAADFPLYTACERQNNTYSLDYSNGAYMSCNAFCEGLVQPQDGVPMQCASSQKVDAVGSCTDSSGGLDTLSCGDTEYSSPRLCTCEPLATMHQSCDDSCDLFYVAGCDADCDQNVYCDSEYYDSTTDHCTTTDCLGSWSEWETCPGTTCYTYQVFTVSVAAEGRGNACNVPDGAVRLSGPGMFGCHEQDCFEVNPAPPTDPTEQPHSSTTFYTTTAPEPDPTPPVTKVTTTTNSLPRTTPTIPSTLISQTTTQAIQTTTMPAELNCAGSWSEWSACFPSCGDGSKMREFTVTQAAANGGSPCASNNGETETMPCSIDACPSPCVGDWGPWGECDSTCGVGQHARTFLVVQASEAGGNECVARANEQDVGSCDAGECPTTPEPVVNCQGTWSDWAACTTTCGPGKETRTFTISQRASNGGARCDFDADATTARACSKPVPCPTTTPSTSTTTTTSSSAISSLATTTLTATTITTQLTRLSTTIPPNPQSSCMGREIGAPCRYVSLQGEHIDGQCGRVNPTTVVCIQVQAPASAPTPLDLPTPSSHPTPDVPRPAPVPFPAPSVTSVPTTTLRESSTTTTAATTTAAATTIAATTPATTMVTTTSVTATSTTSTTWATSTTSAASTTAAATTTKTAPAVEPAPSPTTTSLESTTSTSVRDATTSLLTTGTTTAQATAADSPGPFQSPTPEVFPSPDIEHPSPHPGPSPSNLLQTSVGSTLGSTMPSDVTSVALATDNSITGAETTKAATTAAVSTGTFTTDATGTSSIATVTATITTKTTTTTTAAGTNADALTATDATTVRASATGPAITDAKTSSSSTTIAVTTTTETFTNDFSTTGASTTTTTTTTTGVLVTDRTSKGIMTTGQFALNASSTVATPKLSTEVGPQSRSATAPHSITTAMDACSCADSESSDFCILRLLEGSCSLYSDVCAYSCNACSVDTYASCPVPYPSENAGSLDGGCPAIAPENVNLQGYTCDTVLWAAAESSLTCEALESVFGFDCSGCGCGEGAAACSDSDADMCSSFVAQHPRACEVQFCPSCTGAGTCDKTCGLCASTTAKLTTDHAKTSFTTTRPTSAVTTAVGTTGRVNPISTATAAEPIMTTTKAASNIDNSVNSGLDSPGTDDFVNDDSTGQMVGIAIGAVLGVAVVVLAVVLVARRVRRRRWQKALHSIAQDARSGKSTEMSSISSDRGAMTALPDNFLSLNGDDGLSEQGEVDGRVFDSEMNRSFLQI